MSSPSLLNFGRLDAGFNNARVQSLPTEMADVSGEEYDRVPAINLKGIFNCMKYGIFKRCALRKTENARVWTRDI
jgi:NAD(P)-dependent dehydrogenase (short-subunit alcohol dehydrogenase family)